MIIDKFENAKLYAGLGEKIAKAFAYITETDLLHIATGQYEIEQEDVFARIQEYNTKAEDECKLEGHFKHIDVQYIVSGVELIGVSSLKNQRVLIKNEEEDYAFYDSTSDLIKLESGMFAIFFPDDLHKPCVMFEQSSKVKKVVIKVRI